MKQWTPYQHAAIALLLEAEFSESEACAIAIRWSGEHSAQEGYVHIGYMSICADGRQVSIVLNEDLHYMTVVGGVLYGFPSAILLDGLHPDFIQKMREYAFLNESV